MTTQPLQLYQELWQHQPFKMSLFSRVHELRRVVEQLADAAKLPPRARKHWLREHQAIFPQLLDNYFLRLPPQFQLQELDADTSALLVEYTGLFQELMQLHAGLDDAAKPQKKKQTTN